MDKYTKKIKSLNEVYLKIEEQLKIVTKYFNKHHVVKHKVSMIRCLLNDLYMEILAYLEKEEVNSELSKIVRKILAEQNEKNEK